MVAQASRLPSLSCLRMKMQSRPGGTAVRRGGTGRKKQKPPQKHKGGGEHGQGAHGICFAEDAGGDACGTRGKGGFGR
jgi:hypothetical protein